MKRWAFWLACVAGVAGLPSLAAAQRTVMPAVPLVEPYGPFSEMLVFGDSLSDVGNVYWITGGWRPESPPYYDGRFSNGPVWSEILSERLGLGTLAASLAGGTCYAYGGAETGGGLSSMLTPNLGSQIATHLNDGPLSADQLIVVWGGANDFLRGGQDDPAVPAANLAEHVSTLAAAGGEVFLVPNLPPLGQTPAHRGKASEASMDQLAADFNAALATELDALAASLEITILQMDVQVMLQEVLSHPAAFGFANVTDPALNGGVVPNPEEYLFWDDVHPTAAGHDLLAGVSGPWYPGDVDGDCDVDADDYVILKRNLGAGPGAAREDGDLDRDSDVDRDDFGLLCETFGHSLPGPGESSAGSPIPEPATAAILALGALSLISRRRRPHGSRRTLSP